jgi:hypothetical protein
MVTFRESALHFEITNISVSTRLPSHEVGPLNCPCLCLECRKGREVVVFLSDDMSGFIFGNCRLHFDVHVETNYLRVHGGFFYRVKFEF